LIRIEACALCSANSKYAWVDFEIFSIANLSLDHGWVWNIDWALDEENLTFQLLMVLVEAASHVFFLKKSFFLFSPLTGKRKKDFKDLWTEYSPEWGWKFVENHEVGTLATISIAHEKTSQQFAGSAGKVWSCWGSFFFRLLRIIWASSSINLLSPAAGIVLKFSLPSLSFSPSQSGLSKPLKMQCF